MATVFLSFLSPSIHPPSLRVKPITSRIAPSPMQNQPPPTDSNNPRRVIIVGGGVIGVCTAYFLAKNAGASAAVTLLERSSAAASAASGKAGGFLALDWCDGGPVAALARASFRLHLHLAAELQGQESYGYRQLDTLSLNVVEGSENRARARARSIQSLPDWIDGAVKAPPRSIGTVETTAQVHPRLFTRTLLARAVERHGVEARFGEEVVGVEVEEGRVRGVRLRDGSVRYGDTIVLALGPWCSKIPLVSSLFTVSGLKAHSIVLRPSEPRAITPHALFLRYQTEDGKDLEPEVYPRPTGEVYLCGMSEEVEVPDSAEEVFPNEDSIRVLHRIADTVSPSYLGRGKVMVEAEQACFLPCSDDGKPIIGKMPNVEGLYVGTGHSCWGILNGPATGAALAELVLDGHASVVDLSPFDPSRFLR